MFVSPGLTSQETDPNRFGSSFHVPASLAFREGKGGKWPKRGYTDTMSKMQICEAASLLPWDVGYTDTMLKLC
jgi:hypothetical protein